MKHVFAISISAMLIAAGCGSGSSASKSAQSGTPASTAAKPAVTCDTAEATEMLYLRDLSNIAITNKEELGKVLGMLSTDPKGAIAREVKLYTKLLADVRATNPPAQWSGKHAKLLDAIDKVRVTVGKLKDAVAKSDAAAVNSLTSTMTTSVNAYNSAQQAFYTDIPRDAPTSAADESKPGCPKDAAEKLTYLAHVSDATASETVLSDMMQKIAGGDAAGGIALGVNYYKQAHASIAALTPPPAWKAHHAALVTLTQDLQQTMASLGRLLDSTDRAAATATITDAQREISDFAQLQNDMLNDRKPSV